MSLKQDNYEEGEMQTPVVSEISRGNYLELQKAWHAAQVRLVRASVLRDPHGRR